MTHPILERLASRDPEQRRRACLEAVEDPSAALLVEALGQALGDPVKAVARAASDALTAIARQSGGVEKVLREALHSDDPMRRFGAAFTSARLAPPELRLLPVLVEALGFRDGDLRWTAARLLVETGRMHGEVLTVLLHLVRSDEKPIVRRMATSCLRELAPDHPAAARTLLLSTRDDDVHVRRASLTALAALTDPPAEVIARLVEAVSHDGDGASRRIAALALGELADARPDALSESDRAALRQARDGAEDGELRHAAARALDRLEGAQPKSSASSE